MTDDIPADTGSADPGGELREAAAAVRNRYKAGSPAYNFWRVTAGIWERWAERAEQEIELSAVARSELQAAIVSAREYLKLRRGGDEWIVAGGALSCAACGHVFISKGDQKVPATELSGRLLAHVCTVSP
ncbi:MAG: hypothetical protein J2P28_09305 [Actinobacteria bacterium]|nr:hypothetical protein [Actinomycetota bacterium]MBO0835702.1 hypothetical protein [Actinomycetota bacterium]